MQSIAEIQLPFDGTFIVPKGLDGKDCPRLSVVARSDRRP
jgi:hypothetical protein